MIKESSLIFKSAPSPRNLNKLENSLNPISLNFIPLLLIKKYFSFLSMYFPNGIYSKISISNIPKGRIIKQPDLDVWEEESKNDIPTDEKRYVGERSKLRNSDKSIYYWQKEDGQVGTANGLNTLKKNQVLMRVG